MNTTKIENNRRDYLRWIGVIWVITGGISFLVKFTEVIGNTGSYMSMELAISFIVEMALILIGICLILNRKWTCKVVFIISSAIIIGSCVLGIHLVIHGVHDITIFKTPGSYIRLLFGIVVLLSSIPFWVVNKHMVNFVRFEKKAWN